MHEKIYVVYMMASGVRGTLYVGVTSDLVRRAYEHRNDLGCGFTARYSVHSLVYFESYQDVAAAIRREKRLKRWPRPWKFELVEERNQEWKDLWNEIAVAQS